MHNNDDDFTINDHDQLIIFIKMTVIMVHMILSSSMMMMVMAEDLVQLLLNLLHHVMCELRLMKAMTRRIIIVMIKQSLMEFMCKFKLISFILMISRMMTKCMMIIMLTT